MGKGSKRMLWIVVRVFIARGRGCFRAEAQGGIRRTRMSRMACGISLIDAIGRSLADAKGGSFGRFGDVLALMLQLIPWKVCSGLASMWCFSPAQPATHHGHRHAAPKLFEFYGGIEMASGPRNEAVRPMVCSSFCSEERYG